MTTLENLAASRTTVADLPGEERLALVGDIGGTNARFGLVNLSGDPLAVLEAESFLGRDFPQPGDAISAYLGRRGLSARLAGAVIAVAGPVENEKIHFTNSQWSLSGEDLRRMGFARAQLINDYAALAMAAPLLAGADLQTLGPDLPVREGQNLAVLGPGTGFGVAALAQDDLGSATLATEGGHMSFAPGDEVEIEILKILMRSYPRVSVERILSGRGLSELHQALQLIAGRGGPPIAQEIITANALAGDPDCLATIRRFCAILGSVAGDMALGYGARGGVFVAGGIPPLFIEILAASDFRKRFEAKGRFADYMAGISTRVIMRRHAALLGAARVLDTVSKAG
jgi:glucokinase